MTTVATEICRDQDHAVAAAAVELPGGRAPEWVHLMAAGRFTLRDGRGPFVVDDPEAVIAETRRAVAAGEPPIDYDHQIDFGAVRGVGGRAPAAGWIKDFEVRDGAIWARVEWTDAARRAIEAREYRYLGEDRPERVGPGEYLHKPTFSLVVAAQNLRNERARRHGAAGAVGTYQMLEDLRALLVGQDLGLDIRAIEPGAVRQLVNKQVQDQKLSVLTLELHTAYAAAALPPDANLAEFLRFHADWDIPGGADADAPLPAAESDAADTVNLPGPEA